MRDTVDDMRWGLKSYDTFKNGLKFLFLLIFLEESNSKLSSRSVLLIYLKSFLRMGLHSNYFFIDIFLIDAMH